MNDRQYENLYYQMPRKLVLVVGPGAAALGKGLSAEMTAAGQHYFYFLPAEMFGFPSAIPHETFLNKCYNPDKTQTSYLRFGILPLRWLHKYLYEKPSIILWVVDLPDGRLNEALDQFKFTIGTIDAYIRKNKIRVMLILRSNSSRIEDEKNLFRNFFDLGNRNVLSTRRENFDDVTKEVANFVRSFSIRFYTGKILKYKDNLTVGNSEHIRFQEYYLRNYIKISFFNLFAGDRPRGIKYFDKSYELAMKILYSYIKFSESHPLTDKQANMSRLFYIFQKIDEVKLLLNLMLNWVIFLKMKEKEISLAQAYGTVQTHLVEVARSPTWTRTSLEAANHLWKAEFFYVFLNFFKNSINADEPFSQLLILSSIKNLLDVTIEFIEREKAAVGFGVSTLGQLAYGLTIEKETYNIPLQTLIEINEETYKHYFHFLHDLNRYKCFQIITSDMLRYDERYQRAMSVVMISYSKFSKIMSQKANDSSLFLELSAFRNFPVARAYVSDQIYRENSDRTEIFIRKILDGDEKPDQTIIDMALSSKDQSAVKIELEPSEAQIRRVFERNSLNPYDPILLNLEVQIHKPGAAQLVDRVQLKFNNPFYNAQLVLKEGQLVREGASCVLRVKTLLSHLTKFNPDEPLALTSMMLTRGEQLFVSIVVKPFENYNPENSLKIVKDTLFSVTCDRSNQVIFNREMRSFGFSFTPAAREHQAEFSIKDVKMRIQPANHKNLLQTFKIFEPIGQQEVTKRRKSGRTVSASASQQSHSELERPSRPSYLPDRIMSGVQDGAADGEQETVETLEVAPPQEEAVKPEDSAQYDQKNSPEDVPDPELVKEEDVESVSETFNDYKAYRNRHFRLISRTKDEASEEVTVAKALTQQLNKTYFFKFKMTGDTHMDLQVKVTFLIVSKDEQTKIPEEYSSVITVNLKQPFSLIPSIQSIDPQHIIKSETEDEKNARINANKRCILTYYLRSNINSIVVKKLRFTPGDKTQVLSEISNPAEEHLRNNEGTTFSVIFCVPEVVKQLYSVGAFCVIWRRKDSEFFSCLNSKEHPKIEVFQPPFSFAVSCPFTAHYFESVPFSYTITNTADAETTFYVSMVQYGEHEVFVSGMTKTTLKLRPGEEKTINFNLIFYQLGHVRAPDFAVFVSEKLFTVRVNTMILVDYK